MDQEFLEETELVGIGNGACTSYYYQLRGGRNIDPCSVEIRLGDKMVMNFQPTGLIYRRTVDTESGSYDPTKRTLFIQFSAPPKLDERVTAYYKWIPHPLTGAEVMVRVNNEERWVPITLLQEALGSDLGKSST